MPRGGHFSALEYPICCEARCLIAITCKGELHETTIAETTRSDAVEQII